MESLEEMLKRHQQEQLKLAEARIVTLKALQEEHGDSLSPEIVDEWDIRFGDRAAGYLASQHEAEREAYPESPYKQIYDQVDRERKAEIIAEFSEEGPGKSTFDELNEKAKKTQGYNQAGLEL